MSDDKKMPRAAMGVYAFNQDGQLLLIRSPKWSNLLVPPGGHIEYGERAHEAAKREMKEETGLDVDNLTVFTAVDLIECPSFTPYTGHFVSIGFRADVVGEPDVKLQPDEAIEAVWATPEAMLERDDLEPETRRVITTYLVAGASLCPNCRIANIRQAECEHGWKRAIADYKNLQQEVSRQRSEWAAMSERTILQEFLPVYDNFKKAFAHPRGTETKEQENWVKGIGYIMKQFGDILKTHGIEEIKTVGEIFDPTKHESVGEESSPSSPPHTIIREVEGGYMMRGKVMKVARVIVSMGS